MKEPETGKKENTGKSGYSITTWRLHLWCRHPEWLRTTQEFYNRIAEFYYNLLLDHTELWELGSQQTLRELEIMSIPGRGGRIPFDAVSTSSAEQEQNIFLIRIQLKIELDNGCKPLHTTSQICVAGSEIDPAEPGSIIQHERYLRYVTGVLLKRNWISLQRPVLFGG